MGNRYLQPKVLKELYAKSGNICAFPGCSCELLFDKINLSEICHIQGLNPDSARHNPKLSDTEANCIENLILLCPTHHSLVDQNPSEYTVEYLKEMKDSHESWVAQQLHSQNKNQKNFYTELQKIFQECRFDMIFLEQSFNAPFSDQYFEYVEEGYCRIRDLLNDECTLNISAEIRKDLYSFTQLVEYTITGVAMGCYSNGSGFATPRYHTKDAKAISENIKILQKKYIEYRFNYDVKNKPGNQIYF